VTRGIEQSASVSSSAVFSFFDAVMDGGSGRQLLHGLLYIEFTVNDISGLLQSVARASVTRETHSPDGAPSMRRLLLY